MSPEVGAEEVQRPQTHSADGGSKTWGIWGMKPRSVHAGARRECSSRTRAGAERLQYEFESQRIHQPRSLSGQSFGLTASEMPNTACLLQKWLRNHLLGQAAVSTLGESSVFLLIDFEAGVPLRFVFAKLEDSRRSSPPRAGDHIKPCVSSRAGACSAAAVASVSIERRLE